MSEDQQASGPAWLEGRPRTPLAEAARRAWARRVPLLVVDPGEASDRRERGQLWGELLNHGTPAQLAPLALAELACATADEIEALTGERPPRPRKGRRGASSRQHVGPINRLFSVEVGEGGARVSSFEALTVPLDPALVEGPINAIIDLRIDTTAALVRAALGGDARVGEAIARQGGEATLARAAREALCDRPMPGSRWARTGGLGAQIEGEEGPMLPCGRGRVPARSQRFLLFYTDAPEGRARQRR